MDVVNNRIGQINAAENINDRASVVNAKTFAASNLVGFSTGVSQFTKSDNFHPIQQVKNAEKSVANFGDKQASQTEMKRKVIGENADTSLREENVSFSETLSSINDRLQINGTKISFSFQNDNEHSAKQPVIIVTDEDSGNVIRQIPTEEVQKFAERISEIESEAKPAVGLIVDGQA